MFKKWLALDEKIRFAIMAALNMLLRFVIFSGLIYLFSQKHYQLLLALTWFVSSFIAFGCYKYFVFSAQGEHLRQYLKSLLIWTGSYIVNVFLLKFLLEELFWNIYAAQGVVILFLLVTNYLLFKHFAFKQHRKSLLARIYDIFD